MGTTQGPRLGAALGFLTPFLLFTILLTLSPVLDLRADFGLRATLFLGAALPATADLVELAFFFEGGRADRPLVMMAAWVAERRPEALALLTTFLAAAAWARV